MQPKQLKQLYASLEIADDEIRLLILDYYMSRFNVLKVETMKIDSIYNKEIVKSANLSAAITKLIKKMEINLGFKINRVLLGIPSVNVKSLRKRVVVDIEEGSRKIKMSHVRTGLKRAIDYDYHADLEFVNVGSIAYSVGGIVSRTAPIDERAETLSMDIELLYADKKTVHTYVKCVEDAGVHVMDICLDSVAIAEESVILEKSMNEAIVLVNLEKSQTNLSLFYKGKLIESTTIGFGYAKWIDSIHRKFGLSRFEGEKLLRESCFDDKGIYDEMLAYIWKDRDTHREVNKIELYECIKEDVQEWIQSINEVCEPFAKQGKSRCVVSGDGADIVGISSVLSQIAMQSELYIPSTIGCREAKYACCLGIAYCTRKMEMFKNKPDYCIDYTNTTAREVQRNDESGFTKRLKNILQVK